MRQHRTCKNSLELTYTLLRLIADSSRMEVCSLKFAIKCYYSDNKNTICTHLKILRNSGFIKVEKEKGKIYYCFERNRGEKI